MEQMLARASKGVSSTCCSADSEAGWASDSVLEVGVFFLVILSLVVRDQGAVVRDQLKSGRLTTHRRTLISVL
jgi:hypothetical protein